MRAVNLIPTDQRRGASVGAGQSEGAAYAVIAIIAAIAVLAFLFGQAKHQVSGRNDEISSLNARATTLKGEVSALAPYTSFISMREARENAVKSLIDSRFDWAHALHEFARVVPSDISVASLDGTVGTTGTAEAVATAPPAAPAAATATSTSSTSATTPAASATSATPAAAAAPVSSATPAGSVPSFNVIGCGASQKAVAVLLQRLRLIDGVTEVTLLNSSKGGSSGSSACPPGDPSYTLTITFQSLPSTEAAAAAATPAKQTTNAAETSSAPTGGAQ
jgi:hypothetical protein